MQNLTEEEMKKERKRCMKKLCVSNTFCKQRDIVCDQLEGLGTFILRQGEIEDYVNLEEGSKGRYLKAAEELTTGARKIEFEPELKELYQRLQNRKS